MKRSAVLSIGLILLLLAIVNSYSTDQIAPSFQRSQILSVASSIVLILTSFLWSKIDPNSSNKVKLDGSEGLFIKESLDEKLRNELAWGSQMFLTASAAANILIYWKGEVVLERGITNKLDFVPQEICERVMKTNRLISLVNTKFYPGRTEFDSIVNNLPSIIVCPLDNNGFIIMGGWSERCFTKSDEKWLEGWSIKLKDILK